MDAEINDSGRRGEERQDHARESGSLPGLGAARLLPAVKFGLRAAALAGVVVVSAPVLPQVGGATALGGTVMTTTTLNGPISAMIPDETTCCSLV
jgi:hypothetical protein